jgi:hypothetical protein
MKHSSLKAAIAATAILLSGAAHAEVLFRGKVYQTTADRLIAERQLQCTYGEWSLETLPNGSTVLTRSKVCTQPGSK